MSPTGAANGDSTPHSTRSTPRPRLLTAGDPMALPELDVARVQRWCAARVPEHARHQVRVECQVAPRHLTIVERRAPWREDFGPRMDQLSDRPSALHRRRQVLDLVLARPQSPLPPLRPTGTLAPSRRPPHRDRPRPHLHLLGLTPGAASRRLLAPTQVGPTPPGGSQRTSQHDGASWGGTGPAETTSPASRRSPSHDADQPRSSACASKATTSSSNSVRGNKSRLPKLSLSSR